MSSGTSFGLDAKTGTQGFAALSTQITAEICTAILGHKADKDPSAEALEATLYRIFAVHFNALQNDADKKILYRKLSLTWHVDKIEAVLSVQNQAVVYGYLQDTITKIDLPFKCLDKAYKPERSEVLKAKQFFVLLESMIRFPLLGKTVVGALIDLSASLDEDLGRYFEKLKFFGKGIDIFLLVVLGVVLFFAFIAAVILSVAVALTVLLPVFALRLGRVSLGFFINILSGGKYKERIDAYETAQLPENFAEMVGAGKSSFSLD
jgi:hypothetical protein